MVSGEKLGFISFSPTYRATGISPGMRQVPRSSGSGRSRRERGLTRRRGLFRCCRRMMRARFAEVIEDEVPSLFRLSEYEPRAAVEVQPG
jgi:hypothetical protein